MFYKCKLKFIVLLLILTLFSSIYFSHNLLIISENKSEQV